MLAIFFLIRLIDQQQEVALGYFYGYQGPALSSQPAGFYSIVAEYPALKGLYGLLAGPAFSLTNAFAGLYFGTVADTANRSRVLAFAAIAWSLTSILTGSVNSLFVMVMMRFGLGLF